MPRSSYAFVIGSAVTSTLALLAGCTAVPNVGSGSAPIIGGTVDNGDPAVVLLYAQVPGQQGGSLCTAEVISPHVVLTAAHCVSPAEVGNGAVFSVYVGTDFNNATQANLLAVSETHFDAQFNTNNLEGGHDIGVAILSKAATVTPLSINRTPLDATFVGKAVRFVGYGLSNAAQQTGAGTKRQTSTTLTDYNALLLHFIDGTHETCNGDSGGPAFMTVGGKEVIVGLTSFGDINCNQGGYDTRVDALLPFIDQYVTKFDPAPAAPATNMADMAQPPPDMAQPPAQPPVDPQPSSPPSTNPPASTPSGTDPPPSTGNNPPASAGHAIGEACAKDDDCASKLCGLGNKGTLVCVVGSGNAADGADVIGGCSLSPIHDDRATLAFLVLVALVLSRSLTRKRR